MSRWKAKGPKPATRFCWLCSRQLYGRQFSEIDGEDGHKHAVHKSCAKANSDPDHGDAECDYGEENP